MLRLLLVCIRSYLKSVLGYKFLILDVCHPDTLHLRETGSEEPWLFFKAKRGPRAKKLGKHCYKHKQIFLPLFLACDDRVAKFSLYLRGWY
jgi:hypothetical protein